MNLPIFFRLILLGLIVLGLGPIQNIQAAEEKPAEEEKKRPVTEEQKTTFIQLYSWATILPKELIDLQSELSEDKTITGVEKEVPDLIKEAKQLRWDATIAQTAPDIQPIQVTGFQTKTYRITTRLNNFNEPITEAISNLVAKRKYWQLKKKQISELEEQEVLSLALAKDQQTKLVATVDQAIQVIEEHLALALTLGKKIGNLQILLYSVDSDLKALDIVLKVITTQKTTPSMLSADFYRRITGDLLSQSYSKTKHFIDEHLDSLKTNSRLVLLLLLVVSLAWYCLYKTKKLTTPSSRWYPFATCPLATAFFIGASLYNIISMMPIDLDLPLQWETLLYVLTIFSAARLGTYLLQHKRWKQRLLFYVSIFMAFAQVIIALELPHLLLWLYVFYVSLLALVYYFYQLAGTKGKIGRELWVRRGMGIFPVLILISGITGYGQFAVVAFSTLLFAIVTWLIIWTLYMLNVGFLDLLLTVVPISLIRENRNKIVSTLQPIFAWVHILLLIAVQSVIWDVSPTVNEAFKEVYNLGFDFAGLHISPGFFLTVVFVIYGAFLTSKAIQTVLLTKILPRYEAEKGVQLSITRLVHYAILTIGFIIMLRVLGFQLNQLTLLGGALGVGIGFGLQAIVTNFASGLILLFERPIKVGDTIQVGTEFGEVKSLGLRATIIQTFDNSEIVVPNSDLITGQVTNWTLDERKVRIRISVGVAYGTNVARVLEILAACGKANPMVLNKPQPKAFFLAFGASSLDFELRVWISEFLEKTQVLSDLNQDIDNEFAMNCIEIPFPQSDLHLRSVDAIAASHLGGTSAAPVPAMPQSSGR